MKPDLPGTPSGVLDAFLTYPSNPIKAIDQPPGLGGTVRALIPAGQALPPALPKNPYWQKLNKTLNVTLDLDLIPAAQLAAKQATVIAGGDLPDYLDVSVVPNLTQLLNAEFQDLTDYLSADAVLDYPFLANLPTDSWDNGCVYNGRIYGIPFPAPAVTTALFVRDDLLKSKGLWPLSIRSESDLAQLMSELADPKHGQWASATVCGAQAAGGGIFGLFQAMLGAPNGWRRSPDGSFTSAYETEQTRQALSATAGLWKAGVFDPDSFAVPASAVSNQFRSGKTSVYFGSWNLWQNSLSQVSVLAPGFSLTPVVAPKFDGGGDAGVYLSNGVQNFTAIKKSDSNRVKELLRIANWLAAPFGTAEYLFRIYGIEGVDYTLVKGDPTYTSVGMSQTSLYLHYITAPQVALYTPGQPQVTRAQHDYLAKVVPSGVRDDSAGLQSTTQLSTGPKINKALTDLEYEVIQGRKSLADWDGGVSAWRKAGGDKIKQEYTEAYDGKHG